MSPISQSAPVSVRVGVAQVGAIGLDPTATTQRICEWIARAHRAGVQVLVFPEALLPGYPRGQDFGAVVGSRSAAGRDAFARYSAAAVEVPSDLTAQLGETVAAAGMYVVLGVVERDARPFSGTL